MTTEIIPAGGSGIDIRPIGELQVSSQAATALQEIQGAIFLAKQFPRNEKVVFGKLMESCKRETLAQKANYSFPRGKVTVSGPSVVLARVAQQCYGNMRSGGPDIIRDDEESVLIECWAWDIENNVRISMQDSFKKLVQRKQGNGQTMWVKPDERDLRELINRRGAILERNCILKALPRDLVEDAQAVCRKTLRGNIKDPQGESKKLIMAFSDYGVTVEQLQEYTGQTDWDADTLVELQEILTAIKDGVAKPKEYFNKSDEVAPTKSTPTVDPKKMSAGDPASHQGYTATAGDSGYITPAQVEEFKKLCASKGFEDAGLKIYLSQYRKIDSIERIPVGEYDKLVNTINSINKDSVNNLSKVDPKLL